MLGKEGIDTGCNTKASIALHTRRSSHLDHAAMGVSVATLQESTLLRLVVQQRLPFTIFVHHTVTIEGKFFTEVRWYGKSKGESEQNAHDDECKDPLEGNNLDEELVYCQSYKTMSAMEYEAWRYTADTYTQ